MAEQVCNRFRIEGVKRLYRPGELFKVTQLPQRVDKQKADRITKATEKHEAVAKAKRASPGVSTANVLGSRQERERKAPTRPDV